jgi:hypothetical protein
LSEFHAKCAKLTPAKKETGLSSGFLCSKINSTYALQAQAEER